MHYSYHININQSDMLEEMKQKPTSLTDDLQSILSKMSWIVLSLIHEIIYITFLLEEARLCRKY